MTRTSTLAFGASCAACSLGTAVFQHQIGSVARAARNALRKVAANYPDSNGSDGIRLRVCRIGEFLQLGVRHQGKHADRMALVHQLFQQAQFADLFRGIQALPTFGAPVLERL